MKLTRKDFVDRVHQKLKEEGHEIPWWDIYWANRAFTDCMEDAIENGDSLYVWESFVFKPKLMKPRKWNNFGSPVTVPEHYEAVLIPKKRLIEACKKLFEKTKNQEVEVDGEGE